MKLPIYQVDAFSEKLFGGNPAAVCPLPSWPGDDQLLQNIAAENNLSETAFFVREKNQYSLRWFTPGAEVDLCGHATLASAYVVLKILEPQDSEVRFSSRSGILTVRRDGDLFTLNFPANPGVSVPAPAPLIDGLGIEPLEVMASNMFYFAVVPREEDVVACKPKMTPFMALDLPGVVITAPGSDIDFVSRCFGPLVGVPEDPVTGSAHTTLTPYWSKRLKKTRLNARQLSKRGGRLTCELAGDRVLLSGNGALYLTGEIEVPMGI